MYDTAKHIRVCTLCQTQHRTLNGGEFVTQTLNLRWDLCVVTGLIVQFFVVANTHSQRRIRGDAHINNRSHSLNLVSSIKGIHISLSDSNTKGSFVSEAWKWTFLSYSVQNI